MSDVLRISAGETVYIGVPAMPIDPHVVKELGRALASCKPYQVAEAHLPQVYLKGIDQSLKAVVVVFSAPSISQDEIESMCRSIARWLDARTPTELYVWPMQPSDPLLAVVRNYDCSIPLRKTAAIRRTFKFLRWMLGGKQPGS